ncbi:MAG: hypothetical protein KAI61_06505, partial [Alphaproteobacteria bacterium]|nr:hypothetical protein [Alphaproteobacteria bacterium]
MEETDSEMNNKTPLHPSNMVDLTHDIARRTFQKIKELNLEPIPHIYELWFRYFQGDPDIVCAIDNHPEKMDEATCHRFYKRYLSEASKNEAIKTISDTIQQSITELAGMMKTAKSTTSEYGEVLGEATKKMETAETLDDLGFIVSSIVKDTKMMVQKNHDLEF